VALALWRLSSAHSSPRRAEVGSTTIHDRLLPGDYVNVPSVFILSDVSLIKPPPLSRYWRGRGANHFAEIVRHHSRSVGITLLSTKRSPGFAATCRSRRA